MELEPQAKLRRTCQAVWPVILLTAAAAQAQTVLAQTVQPQAGPPQHNPPARADAPRAAQHRAATIQLDIPLLFGQVQIGEIPATIADPDELRSVDAAVFLRLVTGYLQPNVLAELRRQVLPSGQLAASSIRSTGIRLIFDLERVEARLEVPLEMQTMRMLSLTQGYVTDASQLTGPADVSGYINFLAARDYVSPRQEDQPLILDLDAAGNLFGNVIEGVGTYRDEGTTHWQRGDVRFVHDDAEARTRYSFGDMRYGLDGFQTTQRAGGFVLARNFGLQPYRASVPSGQSQLDIDRNSRVDVIVNGQRVRTLDLGPGRYNMRDFPFVSGTNDVTLRITDEVGRVDVVNFPFVYDTAVLGAGEHDFTYAAGVPSEVTTRGRRYDDGDRVISAFHAYGLSDQLTLGANYQGSRNIDVIGGEGRWATDIGTFRLDAAFSRLRADAELETDADTTRSLATGSAVRLQHRYTERPAIDGANRTLASSLTFRSPSFAALGQTVPSNLVALDAAALYGQKLTGDLYGSVGLGRQFGRDDQPDITTADLNFSLPLGREVTAYLLLGTRRSSAGDIDNRLFFSISWFPFSSGHRFGNSYDTSRRSRRADWSYTSPTRVDAVDADLSLNRDVDNDMADGSVSYTGYRFAGRVAQNNSLARQDGDGRSRRTTVNLGTALAFADGHFAISRPISDSFALFPRHPALSGQKVEVNPVDDQPSAQSDFLGTAILPDLASYYQHHVVFDSPDLPLGYELGQQVYNVHPTYRSGVVIPVGTGATVLGDAILVDATDKPLPLERGQIRSLDDPARPPIEFFTSRTGRFRVEGLSPGRYQLILANAPEQAIVFVVPAGSAGHVQLGWLVYMMEP